MSKNIEISVIIAVYNVEDYIKRCLESIVNQTYNNMQIIIVDDGSTDKSSEICDEYALIDQRIEVIHKENGGLISARKEGLKLATGDYVINIDSDDWIEKEAFEIITNKIEKFSPDILVFGYKKEFDGFIEEYNVGLEEGFYKEDKLWEKYKECFDKYPFFCQPIDMPQCNKAIKREILNKYQMECPNQLKKNTDDIVTLPCLFNINSIYVEKKSFYHYCVRKNSVLWHSSSDDYVHLILLSKYLIYSYKNGKNKRYISKEILLYKLFYHILLDMPNLLMNKNKCMFLPQIKKESKIIIYGKGVFANRLISCIKSLNFCNIVENVDKIDKERIININEKKYDYIVISILNAFIVKEVIFQLIQMGIKQEKIIYINKNNLLPEILPSEIKEIWNDL